MYWYFATMFHDASSHDENLLYFLSFEYFQVWSRKRRKRLNRASRDVVQISARRSSWWTGSRSWSGFPTTTWRRTSWPTSSLALLSLSWTYPKVFSSCLYSSDGTNNKIRFCFFESFAYFEYAQSLYYVWQQEWRMLCLPACQLSMAFTWPCFLCWYTSSFAVQGTTQWVSQRAHHWIADFSARL